MSPPVADIPLIRFDWAIKTILRDKANFDVLEGFLSALLGEDIIIEQLLESESNAEEQRKFNRVDMLVHDSQGRKLIIEVQNDRETDYLERLFFGTCKVAIDNMPLGEPYAKVVKVISISILYFNLGVGDDYVYKGTTEFQGLHTSKTLKVRKRTKISTGKFSYRAKNIFPEYYLINVARFEDVIKSSLDEWIYFLKHSAVRGDFHARHIDKAMDKLTLLKMPPAERQRYENYVKSVVIERDVMATAKRDGIEEGRQEGRQQGLQEGRQEGERLFLLRILERKFGPLSAQAKTRLKAATAETLLLWGESVLDAKKLDDLFNG